MPNQEGDHWVSLVAYVGSEGVGVELAAITGSPQLQALGRHDRRDIEQLLRSRLVSSGSKPRYCDD